jgi:hypothetical protein
LLIIAPLYPQGINELQDNIFQKLLAKYLTGKSQYQALKKDLEKLSGKPRFL